jgi:Putative Actinobacterial Holin-X, holin superfamily III
MPGWAAWSTATARRWASTGNPAPLSGAARRVHVWTPVRRGTQQAMHNGTQDRSLRELAAQLPHDVANLVRAELALMRAELVDAGKRAAAGAGLLAAGLLLGLLALGALTAAAILALATVWPAWLAALVVGLGTGAAAGLFVLLGGLSLRRALRTPAVSVESIRDDLEWLRTRTRSGST